MNWKFWQRIPNPLDTDGLREIETSIARGDRRGAIERVKVARATLGDRPSVRFLEALAYHEGGAAEASELLTHLLPAVKPEFPEAALLAAELRAATGDLHGAMEAMRELRRTRMSPALSTRLETATSGVAKLLGSDGLRRIAEQAETLAVDLAGSDLIIRWRLSDLARLDSLIDTNPDLADADRSRFTSLIGEIVRRHCSGDWLLAPRPEDRFIQVGESSWPAGRALHLRLTRGAPLYASAHRALGSAFKALAGFSEVEVHVEPDAHPAVAIDHAARALLEAGVSGLGVLRERPSPDGPFTLPLSFLDKSGAPHVVYVETGAWNAARVADLRRWVWRLKSSSMRDASILLLAASEPGEEVLSLVNRRHDVTPAGPFADPTRAGGRAATPRSVEEPKLRWLDDKAEVMESLVKAALGSNRPSDLEMVRKIQETVLSSYPSDGNTLAPKQWNALYGYGALYGRILARGVGARWTALFDDAQPTHWEMTLPDSRRVWPLGIVLKLAQLGDTDGDLVGHYLELRAADRDRITPDGPQAP